VVSEAREVYRAALTTVFFWFFVTSFGQEFRLGTMKQAIAAIIPAKEVVVHLIASGSRED